MLRIAKGEHQQRLVPFQGPSSSPPPLLVVADFLKYEILNSWLLIYSLIVFRHAAVAFLIDDQIILAHLRC